MMAKCDIRIYVRNTYVDAIYVTMREL